MKSIPQTKLITGRYSAAVLPMVIWPVMQISLLRFLTLSNLSFSRALTAANTLNPSSDASTPAALTAGLTNFALGIPRPPENFGLSYEIGGPKLRITSCLMNTIAALKELGLGDWDRKIIDGTEYRLDEYPEVGITVTTPRRKRNIQARFVLWATCLGVDDMISKKKFEFAQFEMSWDEQVIGWVQIVNHPPRAGSTLKERQANGILDSGNKLATLPSSNRTNGLEPINITNVIITDDADDPVEARLNVTLEPYGNTLGIYDVFVPIMSGITDMAIFPENLESTGLIIGLEGFKGCVCILPEVPPRTRPPFLEYGWLIRSISRIPTYMLDKGRFGEVRIRIAVDQVDVGFGRLSTRPDCDIDTLLPASLETSED